MKRKTFFFVLIINVLFLSLLQAQEYTFIPDAHFEQALINLGIDTDSLNGKVLTDSVKNITSLNINNKNIGSLTGIEAFVSLTSLICSGNRLTSLDLGNNSLLTQLTCSSNQINSLVLNSNTRLTTLQCASNQLKNLDISSNTLLTILDCSANQLKSLDISTNSYLTFLICSSNQLVSLNLAENDSLTFLGCSNNQLHSLNITHNFALKSLVCSSNQITILDVSNNAELNMLDISSNLLSGLNVRNDTVLTSLNCSGNQLSELDIRNGKNGILSIFNSTNNPYLRCIRVDDPVKANNYTAWQKDNSAIYNSDCQPLTFVPDDIFEAALASYDDVLNDNYVPTANIINLHSLNISNLNIKDLTGIEDFIALDTLICSNNLLGNLDMSYLANLIYLDCSYNLLESLTLKNEPESILTYLNASNNPLLTCIKVDDVIAAIGETNWSKDVTASYNLNCNAGKTFVPDENFEQALIDLGYDRGSPDNYVITDSINAIRILDVSGKNIFDLTGIENFVALDSLNCSSNKLSSLDISKNIALNKLTCFSNFLTDLNVLSNDSLIRLNCGDNKLNSLDISKNKALLHLVCDANNLTQLNVSENSELLTLNCSSNHILSTGLDISKNISLVQFFCSNNELTSIDISKNTELGVFLCTDNHLTDLDLSNNTALVKLDCSMNNLKFLDLSANVQLTDIYGNSNLLESLDLNTNILLRHFSCDNNQLTGLDFNSNDSLRSISASSNKLQELRINNNQLLGSISCSSNQLTSLDVNNNDSLKLLSCDYNKISELSLTHNLLLQKLDCDNNQLTILNIAANDFLKELSCSDNKLDTLDIGSCLSLQILSADNNQLTELNTSFIDSLRKLSCSGNKLKSLDISNNHMLTSLASQFNQLTSLNVKNGNNVNMTTFNLTGNPNLTCIEVDDPVAAGGATGWIKDVSASYSVNCRYADTYVPDDAFEQAMIGLGFDSGALDDFILTASIDSITSLNISGKNISDLTGIKDFVDLKSLNCSSNLIDSLDLGNNTALTILICTNNLLDSLDVSKNTLLEELNFSFNKISGIDLKNLKSLKSLTCNSNELTSLDLTHNVGLTSFSGTSNILSIINVKNGNNSNLTTFNVTDNPYLTCIEVDDPVAANMAAGWRKDAIASFSANCHYNQTYIPDDAFEQALKDMGYDYSRTEPLDDYVPTAKISKITILSLSNQGISNLTGIQDFTNMISLDCSNNILTNLDISSNISLENLNCSGNQLTSLVVLTNTALTKLNLAINKLTGIDISANTGLTELYCSSNQLISLDITHNQNLAVLSCNGNQLISLDANNGHNQSLLSFNLSNNPDLRCVLVDDIIAAAGYANWLKDPWAYYKLECDDADNDGVPDTIDNCPTTPYGDKVDLFGCSLFRLPANNFSILTTSETCRSSNNGKINITAVKTYNYNATITGDGINNSYNFTNTLEIRNLRSGTYELCLTLNEEPGYKNCYDIIITEPEDLAVLSSFNQSDNTVLLKMSGGADYKIDFNGLIFNTSDSNVTLTLDKGKNTITVKTGADCQGIYKETIFLSRDLVLYPNPFDDQFNIFMGADDSKRVNINIYSRLGQLVLSKVYAVQEGQINIDASHLTPGIYFVSMKSEFSQSTFEIIKK